MLDLALTLGFLSSRNLRTKGESIIPPRKLRAKRREPQGNLLANFIGPEGHFWSVPSSPYGLGDDRAFTLLETLVVVAIMITLASMSISAFGDAVESAYVARAIGDIRTIQTEITRYEIQLGKLPDTHQAEGVTDLQDPRGNPYRSLK